MLVVLKMLRNLKVLAGILLSAYLAVALISYMVGVITKPMTVPEEVESGKQLPANNEKTSNDDSKSSTNPFLSSPTKPNDSCFCQLQGFIDDCTCEISTVDNFNNFKIYPRLKSLLTKDYFRYYQVNLRKICPFWSDDGTCALESCHVQECREEEVPLALKGGRSKQRKSVLVQNLHRSNDCTGNNDLGLINTTISQESQEGFERWKQHNKSQADFCTVKEDETDIECQYVDLLLNPERFTGYNGPSAHRVWSSIYNENCFTSNKPDFGPFGAPEESCIEKRTFYRAISGLHASINIHLSAKYLMGNTKQNAFIKPKSDKDQWGPNLTEFKHHFENRGIQAGSWLKNLYFLYILEMKALWKLSSVLRDFFWFTGNSVEDSDVKFAINDLLRVVETFPSHFEETALFSRKDALKLKAEFHDKFTNVTRIMDCVGCEKCRLWGKLQVRGLGTALRVLYSEPASLRKAQNALTRNEIVAFLNAFGKLSESIFELHNFRQLDVSGSSEKPKTNKAASPW